MNKITFNNRKEATTFLKGKGIDTSNWSEEKWLSLDKSQAEIHIQALAEAMWDARNESIPKKLKTGEWHIPFGDKLDNFLIEVPFHSGINITIQYDRLYDGDAYAIMVASARCARLSYNNFDGKIDYQKDIELSRKLLRDGHMSCFEHCAKAMENDTFYANFKGWQSYRNIIENE